MYEKIYSIRSMPRFLNQCLRDGWDVIGATGNAEGAIELSSFVPQKKMVCMVQHSSRILKTSVVTVHCHMYVSMIELW